MQDKTHIISLILIESFEDYVRLLTENKRYNPIMHKADNPEEFARALQKYGYAQDPKYADKLILIMRKYITDEDEFE